MHVTLNVSTELSLPTYKYNINPVRPGVGVCWV